MTGEQMCEVIVWTLGLNATPRELWEASPRGELGHVFDLYSMSEYLLNIIGLGPRPVPQSESAK